MSNQQSSFPLPVELTIQIISYFTRPWKYTKRSNQQSLKNLRLVCKSFHAIASPLLFQRLVISPSFGQLAIANNVTKSSIFGPGVTELMYDPGSIGYLDGHLRDDWRHWTSEVLARHRSDEFYTVCFNCAFTKHGQPILSRAMNRSHWEALKTWCRDLRNRKSPEDKDGHSICSSSHKAAQHKLMQRQCAEQRTILQNRHDEKCMITLLTALPNLRRISYGPCAERWSPWQWGVHWRQAGAWDEYPALPLYPSIPPRPWSYKLGTYNRDFDLIYFPGFYSIMSALSNLENSIEEFQLSAPLEILCMNGVDMLQVSDGVKHLTKLSLRFAFEEPPIFDLVIQPVAAMTPHITAVANILNRGHTAQMFKSAPNLRSMTLRLEALRSRTPSFLEKIYSVPLAKLIPSTPLPFLEEIHISGFDFTQDEIVKFLEDHLETLRVVDFEGLCLRKGTWKRVFETVERMPRLTRLKRSLLHQHQRSNSTWMDWMDTVEVIQGVTLARGEFEYSPWQTILNSGWSSWQM